MEAVISPSALYGKTGIQKQLFNTIYQLTALKQEHPEQLEQAESFLMIPDYFNFLLTGVKRQEYTNATSTNLVKTDYTAVVFDCSKTPLYTQKNRIDMRFFRGFSTFVSTLW